MNAWRRKRSVWVPAAWVVFGSCVVWLAAGCSPEQPPKPAESPAASQPEPTAETPAATEPREPAALPTEPLPTEPADAPASPAASETPAAPSAPAGGGAAGGASSSVATEAAVSSFAPAEDLAAQLVEYLESLEKSVASEQEYADSAAKVSKEANTVIVLAQALGLHDQDNEYKARSGALLEAAKKMAATTSLAEAQEALKALKAAAAGEATAPAVAAWEAHASLERLMEQVPLVNTKLKRLTQSTRFQSKAKDSAGCAAVIAAIGHASLVDTSEADTPDKIQQWQGFCVQMRDAAGAVGAAIRAQDQAAATAAMAKLAKSCDDCHAVFHVEALEETKADEAKE